MTKPAAEKKQETKYCIFNIAKDEFIQAGWARSVSNRHLERVIANNVILILVTDNSNQYKYSSIPTTPVSRRHILDYLIQEADKLQSLTEVVESNQLEVLEEY